MCYLLTAAGIGFGVGLGIDGLMGGGGHRELEQILALVSFAMAGAGFLGIVIDDRSPKARRTGPPITLQGVVMTIIAAPLLALGGAVLLVTLIPAIYVMLPVFVTWGLAFGFEAPPTQIPTPPARGPVEPSYA